MTIKPIFFLLLPFITFAQTIEGIVTKVTNGDTLEITDTLQKKHKIRLAQIDSPEMKQDYGETVHLELVKMCEHKKAHAQIESKTDRYQRKIGTVYCDGTNINLDLISKGLSWFYTQYAWDPAYKVAEEKARNAKIGLWIDPNPIPPWVFRCYKRHKKTIPKGKFNQNCQGTCSEIIKCFN